MTREVEGNGNWWVIRAVFKDPRETVAWGRGRGETLGRLHFLSFLGGRIFFLNIMIFFFLFYSFFFFFC